MAHRTPSLHIALIVPGGVDRSGRERVIPALLWLIERLAKAHRLTVIALDQEPAPCSYELAGARVVCLGPATWGAGPAAPMMLARHLSLPGAGLLRRLGLLLPLLAEQGVDLLHAFWLGETSSLALLAGRHLGVPVVASLGGGELIALPGIGYGGQGHWRSRLHTALALRCADGITAGSRYALEPLAARRSDARWLPLGVDPDQFTAPVERPPGPPWRLVHVASVNNVKDQTTLLKALRLVADACEGKEEALTLDWAGVDTIDGQLQALSRELGLEQVVRFHGFLPNATVAALYRDAHLHVLSSLHESQCVAVCEAAAAGVPTVGTAVGLLPELTPTAALAGPVGDAAALAAGILTLLRDEARRIKLGLAAQTWAQAHDADWTARQFEALYRNVVCRSRMRTVHK